MNLNELRDKAFATATAKGFHDKEYSNEHWLMLVITELSEAVEADRKNNHFDNEKYKIGVYGECQGWLTHEEKFINVFNRCIKDTVEDELADAAIRLLDLAGLRGMDVEIDDAFVDDFTESCNNATFTESVFVICTEFNFMDSLEDKIEYLIECIFGLAKYLNIDLLWHIEQKMIYNEHREPLHGKAY